MGFEREQNGPRACSRARVDQYDSPGHLDMYVFKFNHIACCDSSGVISCELSSVIAHTVYNAYYNVVNVIEVDNKWSHSIKISAISEKSHFRKEPSLSLVYEASSYVLNHRRQADVGSILVI